MLGPLRLSADDDKEINIKRPRLRSILAILLWYANQPVRSAQLSSLVSGFREAQLSSTVRTHIMMLRHVQPLTDRLRTVPGGYLIQVRPGELDLDRFRELAVRGRRVLQEGDHRTAAKLLDEAAALWREPPLCDLPSTLAMSQETEKLLDERRMVDELLIDARLALGQHREVLGGLRASAQQDPMNERICRQLVLALHRCRLLPEAFEAYSRLRTTLAEEYGSVPSRGLQRLYQQILEEDPALDLSATAQYAGSPPPRPGALPTPNQLPPGPPDFIGRSAALGAMARLIEAAQDQGGAPPVAIITGPAGVGKTALALHWAHQVAGKFRDGQLYVNLHGFQQPGGDAQTLGDALTPSDALRSFLDALHVPADRIPPSLEAQVGLYRTLLAGKRIQIVLDNARDPVQVRPLLPGSSTCMVVVTSRDPMGSLAVTRGASPLLLGLLTRAEAHELLARMLGAERLRNEPEAAEMLIDSCAGLPLALSTIAARATASPGFSLTALAAQSARSQRLVSASREALNVLLDLLTNAISRTDYGSPGQAGHPFGELPADHQLAGQGSAATLRAVITWTHLNNLDSLEIEGRFRSMGTDPDLLLGTELTAIIQPDASAPDPHPLPAGRGTSPEIHPLGRDDGFRHDQAG